MKLPRKRTGTADPPEQTRPEDEWLGFGRSLAYGAQHVLTMYGGIIAPPLIVGGAAGVPPAQLGLQLRRQAVRILHGIELDHSSRRLDGVAMHGLHVLPYQLLQVARTHRFILISAALAWA